MIKQKRNGYIGIVVLLVMVVILGIGLSIAQRSSRDIEMTVQEESSTRVFNSAEVGIDQALSTILDAEMQNDIGSISEATLRRNLPGNDADVKYTISKENSLEIHLDEGVSVGVPINTASASDGDTIKIEWSKIACADNPPAILVSAFYSHPVSGEILSRNYAYNINGATGSCDRSNNFEDAASPNLSGTLGANAATPLVDGYQGAINFVLTGDDIFLRIKPIYRDADIRVSSGSLISTAQYTIISQSQSTAGEEETKAIEVKRTASTSPWFMDYTLVSGVDIVK